jgi:DNA polymerase V
MYALVDANSFYASAEKVFDPSIRAKPVVVLTNNDGCICAMCDYAKQTGVKKFGPYHQVKDILAQHGCVIRSSNYELYDDLSRKMMKVIARYAPEQYVYSIDECFLYFAQMQPQHGWQYHAEMIRWAVWRDVRLPVGVGSGPTPTLAKAASHAGKKIAKFNASNIAVISNPMEREYVLKRMGVGDVWGIGRRISAKLELMGIHTAWDLACASPKAMRKQFSVEIERTVRELNGEPCLHWDAVKAVKQQIFSTRAFGEKVTDLDSLRQSLCLHAEHVGAKIRGQGSAVKTLKIFAQSNPFSQDQYYKKALEHQFTVPTSDTLQLVSAVSAAAEQIYQPGIIFHKSGVGAVALIQQEYVQEDLFNQSQDKRELMLCLDGVNRRYGKHAMGVAAKGITPKWRMRRQYLSPQYTTNWADIPKISC